ncbi:MAG: cyanophycin synthetase [Microcystis aeruginosa Ma_QC_C_20070823_S13]|jgi:cyanophycin synthetase|uniref:Cyanophycin synthetase n=1 Tax=Microcystis aeruginosa G11-04 TaxID=2685956 RepID=A0A966G424_MICAE|nr:cyanophycin synthetase [Microcystis aeruginosa SX13-11]NCR18056.1 cyanophycin synthetase [Microcystis aeruginosa LL13-03]NCR44105.1 cyanophycin synthetase [Microcystis aeruginosa SX13-01]NCR67641.1 cyanophycin synthetase [Microcystis aeruginosa LL11-07]NCR90348.1 cyanophycin synthetase [Microcystis aeruginosa G13-10]NCS12510.1 cyanophycin synthetase [Microcystis aeruginosa G13-09]NCS17010.1 cyanophycin synthetase [Microcystis aeruginosa G13-12]NCS20385.1 cyanophycin synthetase [Microcysti
MKILRTQTLRGPNYWSIRRDKIIVMRLDLEDLAEKPSNEIPGFYEGLIDVLPSLVEHYCSPGYRGGFFERVRTGTYMGHIIEHIALELQELAGTPVGFGRTRATSTPGVYNVVFEYVDEQAGRYAGRAAVRLCQSLVDTGTYSKEELAQDLADLRDLCNNAALGPSTETIVKEAQARNIPWLLLSARSMVQLGYGVHQKRIQATLSSFSGILAVELACDKEGTKTILKDGGIPVPRGTVIQYLDELPAAIEEVGGFPIVIKPLDGNHGRGISIDVKNQQEAEEAYDLASAASKTRSVIVERYYKGSDHRILVINGKVAAVAERIPAHVVGDGRSTIEELIEITNQDPNRGDGHANVLTKITIDKTALNVLGKQGYELTSILEQGAIAYLRATANLSTGGIAVDRTDEIHPENVWIAQRVAKLIGLDIAGIDVVTDDIRKPLKEVDGVIVEVNAAPGFRMHVAPSRGLPRNIAAPVIDMLFPPGTPSRVPILAITGTNGKTTTSRLISHICRQTGKVVGFTTTDGVYIDDYLVEKGDNTGPYSAGMILKEPTVEIAVLETARGGILRSGLAFNQCDVGVVLNVAADHLGIGDIDTIEQMAKVKSVVAEVVSAEGYAVLNADDPLTVSMAEKVKGRVAYFSMSPDNPIIHDHIRRGGMAAIYENGYLSILEGEWTLRIEEAVNIPVTMQGMAPFMIANALAACLATFVQGIDIELIRQGVRTFKPSVAQTPGRMNLFDLGHHHALIDYAHNPAGYEAVGGFVGNWSGEKVGVVGGPGDRRDDDLILLGKLSAQMFDRIIVKEDNDTRGRRRGEVADLILRGISQENASMRPEVILDETEALEKALSTVSEGGLVVIFPESVTQAIDLIEKHRPLTDNQG